MQSALINGNCIPIVTGLQSYSLADLTRLCEDYHGEKGRFAYEAFAWANEAIYERRLPMPLIQWALTAYGKCLGLTHSEKEESPVITLHPQTWRRGPLFALDVMIHELLHVYIRYVLGQWAKGKSSHDNDSWA